MTYRKLIDWKTSRATEKGKEIEAIWFLVSELSGRTKANFYTSLDDEVDQDKERIIIQAIDRYIENNEPVQYILGYSYFWKYNFEVNNNVLIPRPETEELVNYVLNFHQSHFSSAPVSVVDIGTGSGVIAITLAKERPQMKVYATDISPLALSVARRNALKHQIDVSFFEGDMLEPLLNRNLKFDILVSNPPYIPQTETVDPYVKNNEPHLALYGGGSGLTYYHQILANAKEILHPKNLMAFEHNYSQKKEILAIANHYFPEAIKYAFEDMSGKDRFLIIVNDGKDD